MRNVSVIIPTLNEEKYIRPLIQSILKQSDVVKEILIIDGGSTDRTIEYAKEFNAKVRILHNPDRTTPYAFNLGVKKSKGNYIFICGAHAVVGDNYIKDALKYMTEYQADIVGGSHLYLDDDKKTFGQAVSFAMSTKLGGGTSTYRYGTEPCFTDTVAFGVYKSEVFDHVGLFNTDLTVGQDAEFNYRCYRYGKKILFHPKLITYYYPRSEPYSLATQMLSYGVARKKINEMYKEKTKSNAFILLLILMVVPPLQLVYVMFLYWYARKNEGNVWNTMRALFIIHENYLAGYYGR